MAESCNVIRDRREKHCCKKEYEECKKNHFKKYSKRNKNVACNFHYEKKRTLSFPKFGFLRNLMKDTRMSNSQEISWRNERENELLREKLILRIWNKVKVTAASGRFLEFSWLFVFWAQYKKLQTRSKNTLFWEYKLLHCIELHYMFAYKIGNVQSYFKQ